MATTDVKSTIEAIEIINESIENGKALLTIQYPCPESEDGLKKRDIECVREGNAWKINISELVDDIMDA